MSAGAVGTNTEDYYVSSSAGKNDKSNGSEVSTDAFMDLLVTQMTNQDPLEPMSNEQMMSQLAQLQTLEEQRDMTASVVEMAEAMSGFRTENGESLTSLLSAMNSNDQSIFVSLEAARLESQLSTASSLIGKTVTGTITDEDGVESEFSGVADSVSVSQGVAWLNFDTGEQMAVVDVTKVE